MKICTFNINGIKARKDFLNTYIQNLDIIALQEIKSETFEGFDGFYYAFKGQKRFNGIATLSRYEIEKYDYSLIDEARFLYTKIFDFHVINIYAPVGDLYLDKYEKKIVFYKRLLTFLKNFDSKNENIIILGDFNISFADIDVFDSLAMQGKVCFLDEERQIFQNILNLGFYDSFRLLYPNKIQFSWFSYMDKNFSQGLRLDYILVSKPLINKIKNVYYDFSARTITKPSDHLPVILEL